MTRQLALATALLALAGCAAPTADRPRGESTASASATAPAPEEPGAPTPSLQRLADYLARLEPLGFSGAAIVEHRGEVVLRRGYGLADRETRTPYTPETVQSHGSITKQITAAAILLLESRGALRVEDSIDRYFGNVPADKQGITMHHLLTHSSGLPGAIGRDREPIGAEAFLERALAAPLAFEPGAGQEYSNVGYSLLGLVVERVGGRPYEAFLREELFRPAGLEDTGYLLPRWAEARLAVGYLDGKRWGRVYRRGWREEGPGWHLQANGGLHTTVDDMRRWLRVLRGAGPLPAEAVERWTRGHVEEGGGSGYGYGWEAADTPVGPMTAHNGGNGVFSADFVWLPEAGLFFYLQGNSSTIYAAQMRDGLLAALFDPDFRLPPLVTARTDALPAAAEARAGEYAMAEGSFRLLADDVRLIAGLSGQGALDAALGHDAELAAHLRQLNARAEQAMRRLQAGREDALAGVLREDEDAPARARRLLERLERAPLTSLTLVGSVENVPGSRFAADGPWTTYFRAELTNGDAQAWSVLWRADGTYLGTAIGPTSDLPAFVLVPQGDARYAGVEREPPWRRVDLRFADDCLVLGERRACR